MFALALVVLVVEMYLVLRWYDEYHDHGAAVSGSASSAADLTTFEGTGSETTQAAEGVGSRGNADEPAGETTFVHTATDENSRGDYTYLSDPGMNGNPSAVVLVTSSADRVGAGGATYGHNIGVWFEPRTRRWAMFNQDRAAVPAGSTFEVVIPQRSDGFVRRSEPANTVAEGTHLDGPLTRGDLNLLLTVTRN